MSEIRFIDTTLRDGNQSLWALNTKTAAMVEIAEQMDQAGFESSEFFVTNMSKKYVRKHKQNLESWGEPLDGMEEPPTLAGRTLMGLSSATTALQKASTPAGAE